jgi:hypothetical protein
MESFLDKYKTEILHDETHRYKSENLHEPIDPPLAKQVNREMKERIESVLESGFLDMSLLADFKNNPNFTFDKYIELSGNETTRANVENDLEVNVSRNAAFIKNEIKNNFVEGSAPKVILDTIERFENDANLSIRDAVNLTFRLLCLTFNSNKIGNIKNFDSYSNDFIRKTLEYSQSHKLHILTAFNRILMADLGLNFWQPNKTDHSIIVTEKESHGLADLVQLQGKPYTKEQLNNAREFLDKDMSLKLSLMIFHIGLVEYIKDYLEKHRDMYKRNLSMFHTIFDVEKTNGSEEKVILSSKFLKTVVNNWVPAIIDSKKGEGVTGEDIYTGIKNAGDLDIFSAMLVQFESIPNSDKIKIVGSFNQICPAKNIFTEKALKMIPAIYEYLKQADKG